MASLRRRRLPPEHEGPGGGIWDVCLRSREVVGLDNGVARDL